VEAVRDDGREIEPALHHVRHLVPVVHLPAVDALERQTLRDDLVHVHENVLVAEAEQADLAAVAHDGDHLREGRAAARHLQTHVEALGQPLLVHDLADVLLGDVHGRVGAHFARELQAVLVHVGDDDAPRARVLADAHRDDADRARTGDEHVLADQREHERRVRRVAEGVEERDDVLGQRLVDQDDVARGDADVLGERAVAVDADADMVLAPLDVAGVAVAAVAAGDVALAADPLADLVLVHALAQRRDLAHVFVSDDLGRLHMLLGPLVPLVDMHVRAADRRLVNFDLHLARLGFRHGNPGQDQSFRGGWLDNRVHHVFHGGSSVSMQQSNVLVL